MKKIALVTENILCGTSRNTGSDKQTYYKLGLGGSISDSVGNMASDLFKGGAVDGDNALCEAALSKLSGEMLDQFLRKTISLKTCGISIA